MSRLCRSLNTPPCAAPVNATNEYWLSAANVHGNAVVYVHLCAASPLAGIACGSCRVNATRVASDAAVVSGEDVAGRSTAGTVQVCPLRPESVSHHIAGATISAVIEVVP